MLFIYFTELCLIFSVIARLSTSGTSLILQSQYKEGSLHLQSLSLIITVEFVTCKAFFQSPGCIPTCYVEAVTFCSCLSIACQKPEFHCSGICKLMTGQSDARMFRARVHSFFEKSGCLIRTLAARLVVWRKLCTEDPQILGGTTIQNLVVWASLAQWNKWSTFYVVMYIIFYD